MNTVDLTTTKGKRQLFNIKMDSSSNGETEGFRNHTESCLV